MKESLKQKVKNISTLAERLKNKMPGLHFELMQLEKPSLLLRFSENSIKQNNSSSGRSLRAFISDGKYYGLAETNTDKGRIIDDTVERALSVMKTKNFVKNPLSGFQRKTKRIYRAESRLTDVKTVFSLTGAAIRFAKKNRSKCFGTFESSRETLILANSEGGLLADSYFYEKFDYTLSESGAAGWDKYMGKRIQTEDIKKTVESAREILRKSCEKEKLSGGEYPAVLSPFCAAEILSFLSLYAFNTLGEHEKTNSLAGKFGAKIFSGRVNISDLAVSPLNPFGFNFDFEGNAKKKTDLVKNGVYASRVYDNDFAARYGGAPTGNALPFPNQYGPLPFNISLVPGKRSLQQIIRTVKRGVFINRLHYVNLVNPADLTLTGLTRDGFFLIEDGKITKALEDMRANSSILTLLSDEPELSRETKTEANYIGFSIAPYIRVKKIRLDEKGGEEKI